MPQYVGGRKVRGLTERQARKAYEAIVAHLQSLGHTDAVAHEGYFRQGEGSWPYGPVLVADFEDHIDWAIVWEGGPYEWALGISEAQFTGELTLDPVVHTEAYWSFALSLYRDTTGL
jgi:hypothetical protein